MVGVLDLVFEIIVHEIRVWVISSYFVGSSMSFIFTQNRGLLKNEMATDEVVEKCAMGPFYWNLILSDSVNNVLPQNHYFFVLWLIEVVIGGNYRLFGGSKMRRRLMSWSRNMQTVNLNGISCIMRDFHQVHHVL